MDPTILETEKVNRVQWAMFTICLLGCIFGGNVSTLMSVYLPVVVKEFLGDQDKGQLGEVSAYINAMYILGWAVGGVTWGIISDHIGRTKAVGLSLACYGLFMLLTAVSPSWAIVVFARFFTGFGVGGVLVTTTTLLAEVWPARSRAIVIGILSIGFPIGIFSAGLINNLVSDWRQAFFMGIVPVGLAILSIWVFKESEKWKTVREAQPQTLGKIKMLGSPEHRRNFILGTVMFGSMLIGLWAIFSWLPTWIQSLITTDAQKERGITMMMLGGGGLLGGFFSGYISNAIGIRKSMIFCFSGCFIMSFLLFKLNTAFSPIIYLEIAILALFFGASQGTMSVYIPLIFPTMIRATATGLCFNIGRLFTASVVFFVGWLVITLGGYGNAIFTFSWIFLVGLIAVLLAGATKEKSVNS
jgi:MFS family permease